jgi:hypothetical protein
MGIDGLPGPPECGQTATCEYREATGDYAVALQRVAGVVTTHARHRDLCSSPVRAVCQTAAEILSW